MADLDPADFTADHIGLLVDMVNEANAKLERMPQRRAAPAPASQKRQPVAPQKLEATLAKSFEKLLAIDEMQGKSIAVLAKRLDQTVSMETLEAVSKGAMVALMDALKPQLKDLRKRLDALERKR